MRRAAQVPQDWLEYGIEEVPEQGHCAGRHVRAVLIIIPRSNSRIRSGRCTRSAREKL